MTYGNDIDFNNHLEYDYGLEPGRTQTRDCLAQPVPALVSIVTATYKTSEHLFRTAASLFNQTFPWFEWIIVDDGNQDPASLDILAALELKDARIRLVRQENLGLGAARNHGIRESSTEIVIPLDDDDQLDPAFVECVWATLKAHPEASIAYTDTVGFEAMNYLWQAPFDLERMKRENVMCVCSGVRRRALEEIGGYEETVRNINEDWHLWLRLLAAGNVPVRMNWFGFWYRRKNTDSLLTKIRSNPELMAINQKILDQEITKLDQLAQPVEGIQYPRPETPLGFRTYPTWDVPVREERDAGKTRILMILPWMIVGGADLFNLSLVKGLDKDRYEVFVMTTYQTDQPLRQQFGEHAAGIFELPSFLDVDQWPSFLDYFIKAHGIDTLFVTNNYFGYYALPWLRRNNPGLRVVDYVHAEFPWRDGAYARTTAVLDKFIDKTYVCNEYTRGLLHSKYGKPIGKVATAYVGVDASRFDPSRVETGHLHQEFGLRPDQRIVLYPCRVDFEKQPFLMLEIASRVKAERGDAFIFVVVGDGPLLSELKKRTAERGLEEVVRFAGRRSDMPSLYRDSALTLICSLTEGLSLTAYESLSMGTPCVSSDVGGQKELVDDATGRIVKGIQDVEEYVLAILDLTADADAYADLQENCRKRILEGFSIHRMIDYFNEEFACREAGEAGNAAFLGLLADDYLNLYVQYDELDRKTQWKQSEIDRLIEENRSLAVDLDRLNNSVKLLARRLKAVLLDKIGKGEGK